MQRIYNARVLLLYNVVSCDQIKNQFKKDKVNLTIFKKIHSYEL
jgi:hypothetical protein